MNVLENILKRLKKIDLTLLIDKSTFEVDEIIVVEHLYGRYGKKPNPKKIDAIAKIKACNSINKIKRFLET